MEIATYKEAAKYVNERISAPAIRELIFGMDEVSHRDIKGIGSINKVLNMEFLLIYLNWLRCTRNDFAGYRTKHFLNINEVLYSLYKTEKLGLDCVIYVLSEAQRDVKENGEKSFFAPYFNADVTCEFGKIYGMIDEWLHNFHTDDISVETILNHFVSAINSAKALWNVDVVYEKVTEGINVYFVLNGEKVDVKDIVYVDENAMKYILSNRKYYLNDMVYDYSSIDSFTHITVIKKMNRR
ncbi:MAG: hypothetical protein E7260_00665 [Lachnospiraceae bacterium]|nr:hypothetical protein [Lachnospiraceae bacterium]